MAKKNQLAALKKYLQDHPDAPIDDKDYRQRTALHYAAKFGHTACLEALLHCGANVNATDFEYNTPLHAASSFCHIDSVKVLLQFGADTNVQNSCGQTALLALSVGTFS